MKLLLTFFCIALTNIALYADDFTNEELGISFTFPDNWEEDKVKDDDKPITICMGIRDDNDRDVFELRAYPSNSREPYSGYMDEWAKNTRKSFKAKLTSVKIINAESAHWYQLVMKYKKIQIIHYQTSKNGYEYDFTFVNSNPENMKYVKETEDLVESIVLSKPTMIETVISEFQETTEHSKTMVMMPKHFYMSSKLDDPDLKIPVNVVVSYLIAIADEESTAYVLMAENYHEQLFGMFVQPKIDYVDEDEADDIVKYTGIALNDEEGIDYDKLSAGAWDQSPDNVYFYQFSVKTASTEVVYYVFYVKNGSKTNVYKFQTVPELQADLEPLFYQMVLESIKNL